MATAIAPAAFDPSPATLLALALAVSLLPTAQLLARVSLPSSSSRTHFYLFIWLVYDALTHFLLEGSFLYHCFFSYSILPSSFASPDAHAAVAPSLTPAHVHFLGREDRRYGSLYSKAPMARLWQEYGKADRRWAGADLTVISLELLTVGLEAPCAAYLANLITTINNSSSGAQNARRIARLWILAIMVSTGELYGGFMTFAPEWLSGNTSLYTDDKVFLWGYLVFANMIWVVVPIWVIWKGWGEVVAAFEKAGTHFAAGEIKGEKKE